MYGKDYSTVLLGQPTSRSLNPFNSGLVEKQVIHGSNLLHFAERPVLGTIRIWKNPDFLPNV